MSVPRIIEPSTRDTELLRDRWFRIVSAYTARMLTYQEDRLTALSGAANMMKKSLPRGTIPAYGATVWSEAFDGEALTHSINLVIGVTHHTDQILRPER